MLKNPRHFRETDRPPASPILMAHIIIYVLIKHAVFPPCTFPPPATHTESWSEGAWDAAMSQVAKFNFPIISLLPRFWRENCRTKSPRNEYKTLLSKFWHIANLPRKLIVNSWHRRFMYSNTYIYVGICSKCHVKAGYHPANITAHE